MGRVKQDPEMRNIQELKYRTSANGWWVRFQPGRKVHLAFYDSQYGGHENALKMAKRFRDAAEREMEPELRGGGLRSQRQEKPSRRNKTGIVGVERIDRPYIRDGYNCRVLEYAASWPSKDGTRRERKRFSIRALGNEEARRQAIEARLKGLHEFNIHFFTTFRPPTENLRLWRYMDFTKFVAMLENCTF